MNNHEKKGKVDGSVLFTVIVVMMVLVVFLMGTLGLASAANKRAQNSYTSSQAQYTARMAVESVLAAMQNDADVAERVYKLGANTPINVDISTDRLAAAGTSGDAYGDIQSCTIENIGEDYYYVDDKWEGRDIIKITATARLGTQDSTVSAYILKKETESIVNNTPSGGGGGLVTAGVATFGTKVSVFGGAGINLNDKWRVLDLAGVLRGYSYDGVSSFCSQDTTSLHWEAPYVVNGSFTANGSGAALVFPKLGSGFTIWGNFGFNNQIEITSGNPAVLNAASSAALNYTDIPYIYVEDTLIITNGAKGVNETKQIPLNVFCGNANITTDKELYFNLYIMNDVANVKQESIISYWPYQSKWVKDNSKNANYIEFQSGGSLLADWTYQLINGVDNPDAHVGGSIFSRGELEIKALNQTSVVEGNLVVDGNLTIHTQIFEVKGDLVVKGALKIDNGGKVKVGGKFYHDDKAGDDYIDKVVKATDGTTSLNPDAYSANLGYPEYMTREYVLGITDETYTGKDAAGKNVTLDRQFVNTLQDTMSTAMDPYKNAYYGLPTTAYGGKIQSWWEKYSIDPKSASGMDVRAYEPKDAVEINGQREIVIANTEIAVLRKGNYDGAVIRVVPDDSHPSIWLIVDDGVYLGDKEGYNGILFEDCGAVVAEITGETNEDGNPAYQVTSYGAYGDYVKNATADANGEFQGKYSLNILLRGSIVGDHDSGTKGGIMTRQYVSLAQTGTTFQIYNAYGKPDAGIYNAERPNVYVYSANFDPEVLNKELTDSAAKAILDEIEARTGYRPTTKSSCPYLNVTTKTGNQMPKVKFQSDAAFISAYIMAPYLDIEAAKLKSSFKACTVYYNGHKVKSDCIGIIGTMIGNGVNAGSDGAWVSLYYPSYVPPVTPPVAPADDTYMNNWALIQFENY